MLCAITWTWAAWHCAANTFIWFFVMQFLIVLFLNGLRSTMFEYNRKLWTQLNFSFYVFIASPVDIMATGTVVEFCRNRKIRSHSEHSYLWSNQIAWIVVIQRAAAAAKVLSRKPTRELSVANNLENWEGWKGTNNKLSKWPLIKIMYDLLLHSSSEQLIRWPFQNHHTYILSWTYTKVLPFLKHTTFHKIYLRTSTQTCSSS